MIMPVSPYIAFEGPIAAGKTTHAILLAKKIGSTLLLEDFPNNEFLVDFYSDKPRWSLPMQLSFLTQRYEQLKTVVPPLGKPVIIDYSHLKNEIFAELLLKERELRLYSQISAILEAKVVPHDVIVYLDASNDVLLERIHNRNRAYERTIDGAYLDSLRVAYDEALDGAQNIVRYDTSQLNLESELDVGRLQKAVLDAAFK
jgi:deoxyguanosine kinase